MELIFFLIVTHTSGTVPFWLVKPTLAAGWFMHSNLAWVPFISAQSYCLSGNTSGSWMNQFAKL